MTVANGFEGLDLRESVHRVGRTHWRVIGRERKVEIVPVFVPQLICIADVSRRVVARRRIARVGLASFILNVVSPGRRVDEREQVAIGVRGPSTLFSSRD